MYMKLNQVHTEADIIQYISEAAEESLYLEFKSGMAFKEKDENCKNEIAKDISAFANADGGILIYGIAEKKFRAASIATFDSNIFTKEWLEAILESRIHRPIPNIIIDPIRIGGDIAKSIFVVRIPRSIYAPHQTYLLEYWKRQNFRNRKMAEYEIREAYTRPNLTKLKLLDPTINASLGMLSARKVIDFRARISFAVENIGSTIEEMYKLEVRLPNQLHLTSVTHSDPFFHAPNRKEGEYHVYSFPGKSALFQGEIMPMAIIDIVINKRNIHTVDTPPLMCKLYFSSGTETIEIPILRHCQYEGHQLSADDISI